MHLVLTLLRKDYLNFKKDRVAVGLTFLVPIVLIYIFGQVFGVNRKDTGPVGIPLAIVNQSSAPEVATLIDALKREKAFRVVETGTDADAQGRLQPLTEEVVRAGFKSDRFRFALVFPTDATSDARFGLRMKFLTNPRNEIETQTVTGLLQKTVYTAAPQLLMQSLRKQAVEFIGAKDTDKFYGEIAGSVSRAFNLDEAKVRETMARGEIPRSNPASAKSDGGSASGVGDFMDRVIKI